MQGVMDGLLDLGVAGRVVDEPVRISLNDVIAEAAANIEESMRRSGLELAVPSNLPDVTADRGRLVTVFQNLLENSAKFVGNQQSPRVKISATSEDPGFVSCVFEDNGVGIDTTSPNQVFEIFTRLTTEVEGHGVGLALVKRIIEAHGGAIRVESAGANQGSTFRFTLPAV